MHVGCVENCILPMCVSDASKQCRAIIMSKLGSPGGGADAKSKLSVSPFQTHLSALGSKYANSISYFDDLKLSKDISDHA